MGPEINIRNYIMLLVNFSVAGAIICFTCRHDAYVSVEYGYQAKFNELEKDKKWTLISNTETDNYRHSRADEFSHSKARVLVYRVLPF